MFDFNPTGEGRVYATNGRTITEFPRLATEPGLRLQVDEAHRRGLTIIGVMLFNCTHAYIFDWRNTLENNKWLGCQLEMRRQPGDYRGTENAILKPAKERTYTLQQFDRLLLGSG